MKLKIELDTESDSYFDDRDDARLLLDAHRYKAALEDMWEKIFRPYYKHGYMDPDLNKLTEDLKEDEHGKDVIDYLSDLYREVLSSHDVILD